MTVHKTDFKDDVKMQYMGGKQLISTRISEVINHEISRIRRHSSAYFVEHVQLRAK